MKEKGRGSFTLNGRRIAVEYEVRMRRPNTVLKISGRLRPLEDSMHRIFCEAGLQMLTLEMEDSSTLRFSFRDETGTIIPGGPIVPPSD